MKYNEDIQLLLETNGCISFRGLAIKLKANVDTAKRMLFEFHENHPEYAVTLSIGGLMKDGSYKTEVFPEAEKKARISAYEKVITEHVYSIHFKSSALWEEEIAQDDISRFNTLLYDMSLFESVVDKISNVGNDKEKNVLLPPGDRIQPVSSSQATTVNVSNKSSASATGINKSRSVRSAPSSFFNKGNEQGKSKSVGKDVAVSNFFQSSTAKQPERQKNISSFSSSFSKSSSSSTSGGTTGTSVDTKNSRVIDDEDDEWDDGTNYKPVKSNLNKRHILDDDEKWEAAAAKDSKELSEGTGKNKKNTLPEDLEVDNSLGGVDTAEDDCGEGQEAKKRRKKQPLVMRGAMDDFVNDHTFEGDGDVSTAQSNSGGDDASSNNGNTLGPNGRRKKLVEKTFADAKGYLVTEMVWEEISAEEEEKEKQKKIEQAVAAEKAAARKLAAPVATKKTGKASGSSGPQKSMMSFFGKKA